MKPQPYKVAAVQIASVFLDREKTIDKALRYLNDAAKAGAKLVVFPEALVPGYPDWVWSVPAREDLLDDLYGELLENSVEVPGDATRRLCEAARAAGVFIVMGVNERNTEASGGSLYNTLLFIDERGELVGRHRKLIPTGGERLMWGQGDGSTLQVYDTPIGKLSGLICWENYMPLARYAMYAWGSRIHVASTWDRGEPWLSTVRHIAKEGRVYVISSCQAFHRNDIPDRLGHKRYYPADRMWINAGDSAIVDPEGKFVAGPLHEAEGILYADIDPRALAGPRWMLDVAGHYARPDVFQLSVLREAKAVIGERRVAPRQAGKARRAKTASRPKKK
ncbi:MAG TPA: carbon-nitrogen hydrolase family protein [Candidatus Binatia bacterium]|nr:carbon-nitrogen hydrolase family protein [Candidatus Binatia bacterium]